MSQVRPIEDLFAELVELKTAADRDAYLDQACGEDIALRSRLEKLLAANEKAGSFLRDDQSIEPTVALGPDSRLVGLTIGPYKLLQQLGEGGMGVVYLAERQKPVKQRVALKIIKQGMDTRHFVARFEAERQALAMMDHPNIAKVLDAGCTDNGRPYFVMELVKGVPITRFCDDNRLTTRERLELFTEVCQAVHHAHRKGIIHRDLKPSNVLVALYDDKPVPKVIDFGVAKATNQQLTEKTLFTEIGSILGTWEYMSPEQAVLNQLDVDTRSDVYALGVLLYELLTGETPLDRQRLRAVQIMETLRMIREDEPPKPSTRVSSLGEKAATLAAFRKVKPESLASEIRGDLDWIVMKALAKERSRRYDSASRFAEDVKHFLSNDIVEARPPSTSYRLRKFMWRNRTLASIAGMLLAGLSVFAVGTGVHFRRQGQLLDELQQNQAQLTEANEETLRQMARAQDTLVSKFLSDVLVDPAIARNALAQAEEVELPEQKQALIRALLDFYNGPNFESARVELERAEDGILKYSIETWVEATSGSEERFLKAAQALRTCQPKSIVEAAIKAQLYCIADPRQAIQTLDQQPNARTEGLLGKIVNAIAEAHLSENVDRPDVIFEATARIEAALLLNPDNPFLATVAISALRRSHFEARRAGQNERAADCLLRAKQIVDRHPSALEESSWATAQLYVASDNLEEALTTYKKGFDKGAGSLPMQYVPIACLNESQSRARQTLDELASTSSVGDSCYVHVGLAMLNALDKKGEADTATIESFREAYKSCDARLYMLYAFALRPGVTLDELVGHAKKLREGSEEAVLPYRAHLNYWADGDFDDQTLLNHSPAKGNFEIALCAWVKGDGEKAKTYFQKQLDLGAMDAQDYWSMYFLRQMKEDDE